MEFRNNPNPTSGGGENSSARAAGIAAGLTMAVGGAVTALMLTADPSIATGFLGGEASADAEMQRSSEPAVFVVDGDGNLVAADGAASSNDEYEEHDEYDDHDEYEYEDDDD